MGGGDRVSLPTMRGKRIEPKRAQARPPWDRLPVLMRQARKGRKMKYYDLDKLKDMIEAKAEALLGDGAIAFHAVGKWLDFLPAADVAPVVHARWYYYYRLKKFVCFNCGFEQSKKPNFRFCPHCGAKMDEGGDNE